MFPPEQLQWACDLNDFIPGLALEPSAVAARLAAADWPGPGKAAGNPHAQPKAQRVIPLFGTLIRTLSADRRVVFLLDNCHALHPTSWTLVELSHRCLVVLSLSLSPVCPRLVCPQLTLVELSHRCPNVMVVLVTRPIANNLAVKKVPPEYAAIKSDTNAT